MDYTIKEFYVGKEGQRIYGQAFLPEGAGPDRPCPLVIFSHEFGADHTTGEAYGRHLASEGVAYCALAFRGGCAEGNRSDGSTLDMSVITEEDDLSEALDEALTWDFVDRDQVFLMGGSQGGVVTSLLAPRRAADIRGIILNYPAFVLVDDAHGRFESLDEVPEEVPFFDGWITVGRRYIADMWDLDLFGEVGAYRGPVLLNHGDLDPIVPLSYAKRAAKRYEKCEFHVIEGAEHGFRGEACLKVMQLIDRWLKEQGVQLGA